MVVLRVPESFRRCRATRPLAFTLAVLAVALLAGCGATDDAPGSKSSRSAAQKLALTRADEVVLAVDRWARAQTLSSARSAAARAGLLVTGPNVAAFQMPGADADAARVSTGLLPGDDGSRGLASALATGCVEADVLGGSWANPRERWRELTRRIEDWRPDNNTFPKLRSHAQRVVGWATLTLNTSSLADAVEYSGHAAGHARVVRDALRQPRAMSCPG